jgi:hypothetical protein
VAQLITIMLGALLRMLLLGAFAALIERGVWTSGQVEQVAIGLAGFIMVAAYALWNHYKNRIKFLTALETPPGTTEAHVDEKIAVGLGASIGGAK